MRKFSTNATNDIIFFINIYVTFIYSMIYFVISLLLIGERFVKVSENIIIFDFDIQFNFK